MIKKQKRALKTTILIQLNWVKLDLVQKLEDHADVKRDLQENQEKQEKLAVIKDEQIEDIK
jgi:hypothetical protein